MVLEQRAKSSWSKVNEAQLTNEYEAVMVLADLTAPSSSI